MRLLEILPTDGPVDPRPLVLAAALSGRFTNLDLPPDLEWARLGFGHALPPPPEACPAEVKVSAKADLLFSPAQLSVLAAGGEFQEPQLATARTAYEWYHDTCLHPQLVSGPVVLRGVEPPADPVPLTRPMTEGRGLWLALSDFEAGTASLWGVGRIAYGPEVWESLGRCPARLEAGRFAQPSETTAHTSFLLSEAALVAVRAAYAKNWAAVESRNEVCAVVSDGWAKRPASSRAGHRPSDSHTSGP
jgi:hypothetical protein